MKKESKKYEECVSCKTSFNDAQCKHVIVGGTLAEGEWACSKKCYDKFEKESDFKPATLI